jgi:hypothetical protein
LRISNIIKKLTEIQADRGDIDLQGTSVNATDRRFEYYRIAASIVLRGEPTAEAQDYCQKRPRSIKETK